MPCREAPVVVTEVRHVRPEHQPVGRGAIGEAGVGSAAASTIDPAAQGRPCALERVLLAVPQPLHVGCVADHDEGAQGEGGDDLPARPAGQGDADG